MTRDNTVQLAQIARAIDADFSGDEKKLVADVTHDSRQVRADTLFVAVPGLKIDGNTFVDLALENGAIGVISERQMPAGFQRAWLQVRDARCALALAAAEVHRHPSRELQLVGITGTNGKTTTAYLIDALTEAAGKQGAMLTTVESRVGSERQKAARTTPEASDTQRFLRRAVDVGCTVAVMEYSSQALDLHRCDGLHTDVAVFTNLTRDHLDYHATMDKYWSAKLKMFDGSIGAKPRVSIVNVDDEYGARLAGDLSESGERVVRYALESEAELRARDITIGFDGMTFRVDTPKGTHDIKTPLVGRPHSYNILAAIGSGLELDFDLDSIVHGLSACGGAPGRFERVVHDADFAVVVDYAHTDDALLNVLRTARDITNGRVITVFGCGGDRDRSKRAPMGHAAGSLSDLVFLTSDNPRTEDPHQILEDAEAGLKPSGTPYHKNVDRRAAINEAIAEARHGDVVVIAGKGHEDYQIIGQKVNHFDDREVAREALNAIVGR